MVQKAKKLAFTVRVRLEQAVEKELPELMLYAFDVTGRFLAAAPVPKGEQGQVMLELPPEIAGTTVRLVLGPRQQEVSEQVPELCWRRMTLRRSPVLRRIPWIHRLASLSG